MSQWQRVHFLDEISRHGVEIETFNPLSYNSLYEVHEALTLRLDAVHFDLFMSNQCNEKYILEETIEAVKRKGIPTLTIRFDNLVVPYQDKKMAPLFDLVWLTAKETKPLYDKWGANSFFAPYAANPYTFQYHRTEVLDKSICFIGTPYGSRAIMINTLTNNGVSTDVYYKMKKVDVGDHLYLLPQHQCLKVRLREYCNRLKFPQGRKVMIGSILNKMLGQTKIDCNNNLHSFAAVPPSEQSFFYSKYALALASTSTNHTDILKNPLKIVNLRNFEIPMSGGIELCRYNPELAEYFEKDKEILFYNNNEELIDKALYYTQRASDKEIFSIKDAARLRAQNEHSWWNRFILAFELLGIKY